MKSIRAEFLWPDALPKYNILARTRLIQLYTFVCTIPIQNSNINLGCKPPFSHGKGSDAILFLHHKDLYLWKWIVY